jgi:uncharacterized membrane protein YsdA (DUF1294 family)
LVLRQDQFLIRGLGAVQNTRRQIFLLALVGGATGFTFGTLVFVYDFISRVSPTNNFFSESYLVIENVILLLLVLIFAVLYLDTRRKGRKLANRIEERASRILQHLDNILLSQTGLSSYVLSHQNELPDLNASVQQSSEFLKYLLDETRSTFEDYTNHHCAVSIKLLIPSNNGTPEIKTYLRDKKSEIVRSKIYLPEEQYPYSDHSPFAEIISGGAKDGFYICNNLRAEAAKGLYRNKNKYWQRFYNSTLIVPIKAPDTLTREDVIGFLCVDSLTAKFDEAICLYIARIAANTVFDVIYALSELERRRLSKQDTRNSRKSADAS